jgi:hypothetical protein
MIVPAEDAPGSVAVAAQLAHAGSSLFRPRKIVRGHAALD